MVVNFVVCSGSAFVSNCDIVGGGRQFEAMLAQAHVVTAADEHHDDKLQSLLSDALCSCFRCKEGRRQRSSMVWFKIPMLALTK